MTDADVILRSTRPRPASAGAKRPVPVPPANPGPEADPQEGLVRAEWFTAGSDFPQTRSHKEGIRWMKRAALQGHSNLALAQTMQQRQQRHEEEKKALEAKYEAAISGLRAQLAASGVSSERAGVETSEAQSEVEGLRYSIKLLRKKLQRVTERELQNHMRLQVFAHLEPVFEKLLSFNFRSPEEVMSHIERLETLHTLSMRKQSEADDARVDAEHALAAIQRQLANERLQHIDQSEQERRKFDKQLQLLQGQLDSAQRFNQRVAGYKDRYLRLNQSVWALWNKVEGEKGMVDSTDSDQRPDFDEPEQILDALYDLLQRIKPSKAAATLQSFTALANEQWRTIIGKPVATRFKARAIFTEVGRLCQERTEELRRANVALVEERAALKQAEDRIAQVEREKRMLEIERERWRVAVLAATGRPRSQSPSPRRRSQPRAD